MSILVLVTPPVWLSGFVVADLILSSKNVKMIRY